MQNLDLSRLLTNCKPAIPKALFYSFSNLKILNIFVDDRCRMFQRRSQDFHKYQRQRHCVKSVRVPSCSGPYFPVFSPNAGKHGPE